MALITLKITPLSSFATLPKGDTLFGQVLAYLYLNEKNNREVLKKFDGYFKKEEEPPPPLVISDIMPYGYLHKPTLPIECFSSFDTEEVDKKKLRKKEFISVKNLQNGDLHLCEKIKYFDDIVTTKNSINRATFITDGENFAPYGLAERQFYRKLWIFILVESSIKDKIINTIREIGKFGFGKDANLGRGNFDVKEIENPIKKIDNPLFYLSISPTLLQDDDIVKSWYNPFTRFGKFGLHRANKNAFKNPVLMADSGAVVKLSKSKEHFGTALNNGTKEKISHLQGYSIAIPFKIKDTKCLNID